MAKERKMCFIIIGCILDILLTSSTNTMSYNLPAFLSGIGRTSFSFVVLFKMI